MATKTKKLSVVGIRALREPGRYNDGGGLYLHVRSDGRRGWAFRYRDRITSKLREKGLGPLADVTLEQAREKAAACRASLLAGVDPLNSAREAVQAKAVAAAKQITLGECVNRYIAAHKPSWRNAKHGDQWRNTLDTYAATLLPLPVSSLDTHLVLEALTPIWATKTETATRVRQRIEAVIDYAIARGYRAGENPARWRSHLQKLLPPPAKLKNVQHHPALPYNEIGAFLADVSELDTLASKALRLQILTATRPGEAIAARWSEVDLTAKTWTIPKERMKAHTEHRVPLAPGLLKLLKALPQTESLFLFPGKPKRHMTTAAVLAIVKDLRPGLTSHGFRSSFRDWAADQTAYPRDVAEAALAHAIKDKTEAAYRRSDLFEKRARMMADWERHCYTVRAKGGNVTPLKRKASGSRR